MDLVEQLDHIFSPKSIAVIGASANPEKVGFMCVGNLLEAGFGGRVYPVNPRLSELFGLRAYPSVTAIPGEVDLAMVVIPAELTISTIEECVAKGIKGAILISGGFKEVGTEIGSDLQAQIRDVADRGGMKIIGPNTLGLVNSRINLNATFQTTFSLNKAGSVGVAAQSGGMCIYIANVLTNHNVGIDKIVSLGNRCNLDFDEVVTYFGQDKETEVIVLYVEGLEQPHRLINAARQVTKQKPIVVYKAGRGGGVDRATLSHTGALAGKYEFYKAAFRQAGMIMVDDVTELVDVTKTLAFQPVAMGNRVAIFSVQAGPGIIMIDKCRELGLRLAQFSPTTRRRLKQLASPINSADNPVDLGWKSDEFDACREMLKIVLEDDSVDAVAVAAVFLGLNMEVMRALIKVFYIARYLGKPIVVCLSSPGGSAYAEINTLEESRIPTFPLPERAITGLAGLVKYGEILKGSGGGGGIRTHGSDISEQRFSRPSP